MEAALLAFSIGPVQDFIAAARTTRDLWTGSYLLSWLTAHALAEVEEEAGVELIFPSVKGNALYAAAKAAKRGAGASAPPAARRSTLPNTFVVQLSGRGDARELARRCRAAVDEEWHRIQSAIHDALRNQWDAKHSGWDARWAEQVDNVWDVRTTVLPGDEATDPDELRRLLGWTTDADLFSLRMELLARLAKADKQIRHYPPDETEAADAERVHAAGASNPGDPDIRPKDSLLGTWAQMGPLRSHAPDSQMSRSREFWEAVRGTSINGTHLGERDRLSAVSLVKRFAWPVALAPALGMSDPRVLRFADIHTLAAREWLKEAGIDWQTLQDRGDWSGYWLRWESVDRAAETGEPEPPQEVWDQIQDAKRVHGDPPVYYAVLMLDGDNMGDKMRTADRELRLRISAALGDFSAERAPGIVERHGGELVYAGGDDVLALLPLPGALACARELAQVFSTVLEKQLPEPQKATVSAGLVVAHVMEDLRAVLEGARDAERQAKNAGRNRLALSVRRRSGEHATVVPPLASAPEGWALVPHLDTLAAAFRGEDGTAASSRWAYTFREQLARLPADPDLQWAELTRLLARGERTPNADLLERLWKGMGADRSAPASDSESSRAVQFIQLVQSAAFIARSQ